MIKRYACTKDTSVTDAFKLNMLDRAEESNMGASDIVEVFSIYGQATSGSSERCRAFFEFDVEQIASDRDADLLPDSGSVSFYLRAFNAPHAQTLPRQYTLQVLPLSSSWTEGIGLDMETYNDEGEANWLSCSLNTAWTSEGGDFLDSPAFEQYFDEGDEDLEIDITQLVEAWIEESTENNGVVVKLSGSLEDGTEERSYYTKRFFARGTEFFYKQPVIEARWDASRADDRGNFYLSSSMLSAEDNENRLYLYNYVRGGSLKDIPSIGSGSIYVSLQNQDGEELAEGTGSWESTGIYRCDLELYTTASAVYDVWHDGAGTEFHTGYFEPLTHSAADYVGPVQYHTKIVNLKSRYSHAETNAMFRLFVREKNWQPTIYTVATADVTSQIIERAYYRIFRVVDNYEVIPYGNETPEYTKLSYDADGNYFYFDMSLLESGYMYGLQFLYHMNDVYVEQPEIFKFRVDD